MNNILEFNKIKEMLLDFSVTEFAKEKIENLSPFLREIELRHALNETSYAREIIDFQGNPPIPNVYEAKTSLELIEKEGILYPDKLESFMNFISSCRRLKSYLKKACHLDNSLAYNGEVMSGLDDIFTEINRCIIGHEIDSNASNELRTIRRKIENTNTQIKVKLEDILKSKKSMCSESFLAIKNGVYTLPVKKEFKNQVSGTVIAVSQTGTTYFIEPSQARKLTDTLNSLKIDESLEVEKILYTIASFIDLYKDEIYTNISTIEALDFAFAKAKLSVSLDCIKPEITLNREIYIKKGRHPMINRDECVPIDFKIGGDIRGIIITGPNTGGKTAALKLVGLFSMMAQSGLHLPCENAKICMNSNVLCDIGDGQNITQNLSTFSAHILNIIKILEQTSKDSLVLLDELGSGTDPSEGMGIAVSILEELRLRNCLFVATTHYPEVKTYAENAEGLINAKMTFNSETLKPNYKLVIGEAGESSALHIAKKLGFPSHMLALAYNETYTKTHKKNPVSSDFAMHLDDNAPKKQTIRAPKIEKIQEKKEQPEKALSFGIGDSVNVLPDKKIGIVYKECDDDGNIGVQISGKKEKINYKRLEILIKASELYPADYDFSIIFDSVDNRKARKKMTKRHVEGLEITINE